MDVSSDRRRVRPIVVDFLATLFYTFCIGVGTAVALGACVVLLAGPARGSETVSANAARVHPETLPREPVPSAQSLAARSPEGEHYRGIFGSTPSEAAFGPLGPEAIDHLLPLLTGALALLLALILFPRIEGRQRRWSSRAQGRWAMGWTGLRQALASLATRWLRSRSGNLGK
jgi:hypothetical protein